MFNLVLLLLPTSKGNSMCIGKLLVDGRLSNMGIGKLPKSWIFHPRNPPFGLTKSHTKQVNRIRGKGSISRQALEAIFLLSVLTNDYWTYEWCPAPPSPPTSVSVSGSQMVEPSCTAAWKTFHLWVVSGGWRSSLPPRSSWSLEKMPSYWAIRSTRFSFHLSGLYINFCWA